MFDDSDTPFLTIDETAKLLRVNRRTLDNLRWSKEGPPSRRHGGRVVYHRHDVLEWSERRRARTPPPKGTNQAPSQPHGDGEPGHPDDCVPAGELSTPPVEREP